MFSELLMSKVADAKGAISLIPVEKWWRELNVTM